MSDGSVNVNSGIGFNGLLFIAFLVLKLTGVISWSWWWVTAPLWIPFGIGVAILLIVAPILIYRVLKE